MSQGERTFCPLCGPEGGFWSREFQHCEMCGFGKPETIEAGVQKPLYCSFCGKEQSQVKRLIAGPTVFICDECVELCGHITDEELSRENARLRTSNAEMLEALRLTEESESAWANCPECQGAQSWPELCEDCFPRADRARIARRNAFDKAKGEREGERGGGGASRD